MIDTKQKEELISKESLIDTLFNKLQEEWVPENIVKLDSLGTLIAENEDFSFLPFNNKYEENTFIFHSQSRDDLNKLEQSSFLMDDSSDSKSGDYKVWRKRYMNHKILDISIEPHPILHWTLNIRLREGE